MMKDIVQGRKKKYFEKINHWSILTASRIKRMVKHVTKFLSICMVKWMVDNAMFIWLAFEAHQVTKKLLVHSKGIYTIM